MISTREKSKVKQMKASTDQAIEPAFKDFVLTQDHPCIMAQTVFSQEHIDLHTYDEFPSRKTAKLIYNDLEKYIENYT